MPFIPNARPNLLVRTSDGHNVTLSEPLIYTQRSTGRTFLVPSGSASDGLSIPEALWSVAPPFGVYWLAGVLHDAAYRATLQELPPLSEPVAVTLSKVEADALFLEAMLDLGTPSPLADAIYEGVNLGGRKAFVEDRK